MNCTNCGAVPTREALALGNCSYCSAALPHVVDDARKAAIARELLADKNNNGIPDIYEPALRAAEEARQRSTHRVHAQRNWQHAQHMAAAAHAQNVARAHADAQRQVVIAKSAKVGIIIAVVSVAVVLLMVLAIVVAVLVGAR